MKIEITNNNFIIVKVFFLFLISPFFLLSQEKFFFDSANPFSFKDIIVNLDNQKHQRVFGILKMPIDFNTQNQYPLVIAVAGSNGWASHHYDYLKTYRENGIATFELCSFQSRGIKTTVGNQVSVTTAMMILDSFRALEALQNHPNIHADKIAITGWSLGGGVSLFSAWEPLKKAINPSIDFAAHLALYPPCIVVPDVLEFGDTPIHILIGELDNWTPAEACLSLVSKLKNNTNIDITIYPNAHHSFDRDTLLSIKKNGYILEDCRFRMNAKGEVLMNFLNFPMTTPLLQKIGLSMCARRGPTYGGNSVARVNALSFSKNFMIEHLF